MNIDYEDFTYPSVVTFACQMTLRQWYAGQALAGVLANAEVERFQQSLDGKVSQDDQIKAIAELCHTYADALIEAEAKE